jgi:hypothetical protein
MVRARPDCPSVALCALSAAQGQAGDDDDDDDDDDDGDDMMIMMTCRASER